MLRNMTVMIGFALLARSPAHADVINVSVNGSLSGSGQLEVECFVGTPGCNPTFPFMELPYSFSASNTSLGFFTDFASATASNSDFPGTASIFANQDVSATSNSLDIALMGGHSAESALEYESSESDTISVSFDLTEASLVELTGGDLAVSSNAGELLDSNGNVILTLPNNGVPLFADLEPGIYTLTASASASAMGGPNANVASIDFNGVLDASFTALPTPEPAGAPFAASFVALIGVCVLARRPRTH